MILGAALLLSGTAGMLALGSLKENLQKETPPPPKLTVSVMEVQPVDLPFTITGYGELKTFTETVIAAEVSGRILYINPKLKPGEMVSLDELLVRVDDYHYRTDQRKQAAVIRRITSHIQQQKTQLALDRERYAMAHRNQHLAMAQYDRLKRLYYDHGAGSQTDLGEAEHAVNQAGDSLTQLALAIEVSPHTIEQSEWELEEAKAQLDAVREDIKRCKVFAPFSGRVKTVDVKTGQYVEIGQKIATLADDSILEVEIAITGKDMCQWLQFEEKDLLEKPNWFRGLKKVTCKVQWLDENRHLIHEGVYTGP